MKFYLEKEEYLNLKSQLPIKWCGTIFSGWAFTCCKLHRKSMWSLFIILSIIIIYAIIKY